jgi:hypothetical protein
MMTTPGPRKLFRPRKRRRAAQAPLALLLIALLPMPRAAANDTATIGVVPSTLSINRTPDQVKLAIAYADPEEKLDVKDILHQIDWYHQQGMLKGEVDAATVIDKRYVIPLPH